MNDDINKIKLDKINIEKFKELNNNLKIYIQNDIILKKITNNNIIIIYYLDLYKSIFDYIIDSINTIIFYNIKK